MSFNGPMSTGPINKGPAQNGYDAVLLVSFGGPEGPGDVLPFLRNVTRGRGIPDERLAEVAEHYYHFGGISPINQWCREVIEALRQEFRNSGIDLPIYWGNRNWPPMLVDAVTQMTGDGVKRALALCTSAYGSYSSCRQYVEDINAARAAVGETAPAIDKIRHFFDHPGFVGGFADAAQGEPRPDRGPVEDPRGLHRPLDPQRLGGVLGTRRRPLLRPGRRGRRARRRARGLDRGLRRRLAVPLGPADDAVARTRRQRPPQSRSPPKASTPSWSAPSGSSRTTSKCCGTSTTRPRTPPPSSACATSGRHAPASAPTSPACSATSSPNASTACP